MGQLQPLVLADILIVWVSDMNIQGLEKISMVDYPNKIATTVFTGGCNFRCPFCHNAGIVEKRYNSFDEDEIINYLLSRKKNYRWCGREWRRANTAARFGGIY